MPTLTKPWNPVLSGQVRSPIVGNNSYGAATRLPDGRGLWLALVGGKWEAWRTKGAASELVRFDGSVEKVATVLEDAVGPIVAPAQAALTWIDGTLYASVNGRRVGSPGWTYVRVMRDTSEAKDGSGPWVTHGLLPTDGARLVPAQHFSGAWGGCEIVTAGSTWATLHPRWGDYAGAVSTTEMCISSSTDGGATWVARTPTGVAAGMYGLGGSRNIAQWRGKWYIGGRGNTSRGYHYASANLTEWQEIGGLDTGSNSNGRTFPVADSIWLWSMPAWNPLDSVMQAPLQSTENATPVGAAWVEAIATTTPNLNVSVEQVPYLHNIGTDSAPLWVACGAGRVRALSPLRPPVTRKYPRTDGLGLSSAPRRVGQVPRNRIVGGHP